MSQPLMPKATAVWLIDNTTLTFKQIADFVGLHPLEIAGIADGEVAVGIKGMDPVAGGQLTREVIEACEKDSSKPLKMRAPLKLPEQKKRAPRYTPLSKRQERPSAIAWLVRNHPEVPDSAISKLLGTTKQTIQAIRDKTHWNAANIQPVDPVALGLCAQSALDAIVRAAAEKRAKEQAGSEEEGEGVLMSTEKSLSNPFEEGEPTDQMPFDPFADAGKSTYDKEERRETPDINPEDLFNLPKSSEE
ncbi:MAG: DUF1013 domain-containing protein [Neomegalonema sp.]|nr:DUF1013 domain-containing protein [Neomegalonema sp.]